MSLQMHHFDFLDVCDREKLLLVSGRGPHIQGFFLFANFRFKGAIRETLVWNLFALHLLAPSPCALAVPFRRGSGTRAAAHSGQGAAAGASPVPRRLAAAFTLSPLGVCVAEGIEAKRAKTEDRVVLPISPGWLPGRRR